MQPQAPPFCAFAAFSDLIARDMFLAYRIYAYRHGQTGHQLPLAVRLLLQLMIHQRKPHNGSTPVKRCPDLEQVFEDVVLELDLAHIDIDDPVARRPIEDAFYARTGILPIREDFSSHPMLAGLLEQVMAVLDQQFVAETAARAERAEREAQAKRRLFELFEARAEAEAVVAAQADVVQPRDDGPSDQALATPHAASTTWAARRKAAMVERLRKLVVEPPGWTGRTRRVVSGWSGALRLWIESKLLLPFGRQGKPMHGDAWALPRALAWPHATHQGRNAPGFGGGVGVDMRGDGWRYGRGPPVG